MQDTLCEPEPRGDPPPEDQPVSITPPPLLGPAPPLPTLPLAARGPDAGLTNDDCPVIRDEHLAVNIDEL